MNCEQVKELLSPYLDDALAPEERRTVAAHLEHCPECNRMLADFHRFDTLLAQMPHISPDAALRERIFSSLEYLELTGTSGALDRLAGSTIPQQRIRPGARPRLVALPGGRGKQPPVYKDAGGREARPHRDRVGWGQRAMQVVIAATVLLTLGIGGFIGWNLWQKQTTVANNVNSITPPAALQQGPIPAGTRFLFPRSGALWSAPSDGSNAVRRLTPTQTTVATGWTVRPALVGRSAGDLVAYIDLQQGRVHIVRSDGQNDTAIQQPLLQSDQILPAQWKTGTGSTILNSLAWSKDGSMLAFIAAPRGIPQLYIYTPGTGALQQVALPMAGAVSHLVWSPDGIRIAFEVQANGNVYILDYNTQNRDALTLSTVTERPGDTVLLLDWSSGTMVPTLTWSVGGAGHIHSIWKQSVAGNMGPTLLISGDYLEAQYSQHGRGGTGSWLLVANNAPGAIVTLNLVGSLEMVTSGQQVSAAQWSPDGLSIGYFATLVSRSGAYHVVNTLTGVDTLIATGVAIDPAPTWSADSSHLAYSIGVRTQIVTLQGPGPAQSLKQQGTATALSWSSTIPSQLVLVVNGGQQHGIYLVDTQHNTSLQLDKGNIQGPIQWSEIP